MEPLMAERLTARICTPRGNQLDITIDIEVHPSVYPNGSAAGNGEYVISSVTIVVIRDVNGNRIATSLS